jgi:hypothetical protein
MCFYLFTLFHNAFKHEKIGHGFFWMIQFGILYSLDENLND